MVNFLFKKSYQLKTFQVIPYKDLWNRKGVFTTIRVYGKFNRYILLEQHLVNFNNSLSYFSINFQLTPELIINILNKLFNKHFFYDHLLRIAVNNNIISFSLRKRPLIKKIFKGILVSYKRSNAKHKHLRYNKVLQYINSIKANSEEIIFMKNNYILEGCTTNILCVKNKKIYSPKSGFYYGTTLFFLKKKLKDIIIKKNITKIFLKQCDEILLIGSGKGVVSINHIPQIMWHKRRNTMFNHLDRIYNSLMSK